jgi:hypothetical protein
VLLEFYRYPAERWIHLRTTNPIECTFATVRLPTKITKGPGSHAAGLAMACSRCWRLSSLKDQWYEQGLRASSVRSLTRPLFLTAPLSPRPRRCARHPRCSTSRREGAAHGVGAQPAIRGQVRHAEAGGPDGHHARQRVAVAERHGIASHTGHLRVGPSSTVTPSLASPLAIERRTRGCKFGRATGWTLGRVLQNALWDIEDGDSALDSAQIAIAEALMRRAPYPRSPT